MRLGVSIFGEQILFFNQPVDLKPVVEAVFVAGVVRSGVGLFVDMGNVFQEGRHNCLRADRLAGQMRIGHQNSTKAGFVL